MVRPRIYLIHNICLVLFCTMGICSGDSVAVQGVSVICKEPPVKLNHCTPYTMTIEAKFNNPLVRKETRKGNASWSLDCEVSLKNKATNNYEIQNAGFEIHRKPDGSQTDTWEPIWTCYKYRRTKATVIPLTFIGDGDNNYNIYSHFARGSYFKTPGCWKTKYTASLSVPNKKDNMVVYTSSASDSFNTDIEGPKLYVYAVEGFFGRLPGLDHLNKNILSKLENCECKYHHLYQESNILKPAFGSIENDIYFDSDCGCNKIALLGYSYGGHEVIKIAEKVGNNFNPTLTDIPEHAAKIYPARNIGIDLMITLDPVKQGKIPPHGGYGFVKPGNVAAGLNLFQQADQGSLVIRLLSIPIPIRIFGDTVDGSTNVQYPDPNIPGAVFTAAAAHVEITMLSDVQKRIKAALDSVRPL